MAIFLNLLIFMGYASLAAGVATAFPYWMASVEALDAKFLGLLVLLGGAILHESLARRFRQGASRAGLREQDRRITELEEELKWTRRELRAVREALEALAERERHGAGDAGKLGEVMAELNVLKGLLSKVAKSGGLPKAAAAPAKKPKPASGDKATPMPVGPARSAETPKRNPALEQVKEALREDRVELVLQPIVSLPQRQQRHVECFSRLITVDGKRLLPESYIELAESAGLITAIDNMLLFRCIQLVRQYDRKAQPGRFFCNVSPHTLRDEAFFGDFLEFLESNPELGPRLVFEFTQADFAAHGQIERRLLDRLAAIGCSFSLDRVEDRRLDAAALEERGVRFVKIAAEKLTVGRPEDCHDAFESLSIGLRRHGIDVVVEKIEDEGTLLDLLDFGAVWGQGYLFGEPKAVQKAA